MSTLISVASLKIKSARVMLSAKYRQQLLPHAKKHKTPQMKLRPPHINVQINDREHLEKTINAYPSSIIRCPKQNKKCARDMINIEKLWSPNTYLDLLHKIQYPNISVKDVGGAIIKTIPSTRTLLATIFLLNVKCQIANCSIF